jgi:hypothetical protein
MKHELALGKKLEFEPVAADGLSALHFKLIARLV